ncbi:hypothetical protein K466DRAFT_603174 [Polyporus arcularius HHB13444]|uniref:Uncharacterized protein n=1 Tax=Polyporus arcularius HHB13444 TaxID=1314778 RepID=A0A5C3P0D2_9APHY|nr:hypothetical protein K466DRAFT_603174 [Polyporus arcularius HHB13444]
MTFLSYVDECIQQERMLFPDDPISSLPQLSTPPAAVQTPHLVSFPDDPSNTLSPLPRFSDSSLPVAPLPRRSQHQQSASSRPSSSQMQSQSSVTSSSPFSDPSARPLPDALSSPPLPAHPGQDRVSFGARVPPLTLSPLAGASSLSGFPDHGRLPDPSSLLPNHAPPQSVNNTGYSPFVVDGRDASPPVQARGSRPSATSHAMSSAPRQPDARVNHDNVPRAEPRRASGTSLTGSMASSQWLSGPPFDGNDSSYGDLTW